eukprot:scaffold290037_cov24-Attheya_sp.AAC.1
MSATGFHNTDTLFEDHITNLLNELDEDETDQTTHGIQTTLGEERENEPYEDSLLQKDHTKCQQNQYGVQLDGMENTDESTT